MIESRQSTRKETRNMNEDKKYYEHLMERLCNMFSLTREIITDRDTGKFITMELHTPDDGYVHCWDPKEKFEEFEFNDYADAIAHLWEDNHDEFYHKYLEFFIGRMLNVTQDKDYVLPESFEELDIRLTLAGF